MVFKIISGGQTGSDQAGWRAALNIGLETGGWMPHDFGTEDGPRPEFAQRYGAKTVCDGSRERSYTNVRESHATVWFGEVTGKGGKSTITACERFGRPCFFVSQGITLPAGLALWLQINQVEILNIAGIKESDSPGIGEWVESFLIAALGHFQEMRIN